MIIKMNQISRDSSGLSVGIGGFDLQVTPDGGTDYEFIYNNNIYATLIIKKFLETKL